MQIGVLREFAAVARGLNFTSAAQQCHVTQSVLSRHMSSLEKELDVKLFNRTSRGARLTPFGELFASSVEKMLMEYDLALSQMRGMKNNFAETLKIGYLFGSVHAFLPSLHTRFCELHPETQVRLVCIDGGKIMDALESNEINMAITMMSELPNPSWYSSHLIYDDFYGAIVREDHPLAARGSIELGDLNGETVYIFDPSSYRSQWEYLRFKICECGASVELKEMIHDAIDMPMFVKNHNVVSLAPQHLLFALDMEGLRFLPIRNPYLTIDIRAVWKKSKETPALLSFIDCLKDVTGNMSTEALRNAR
ncbi:MAG: LysR family transcriptional regulator [Coriobacteriales bacterium]